MEKKTLMKKPPPLLFNILGSWIEKILRIPTAVCLWKWSFSKANQFRTLLESSKFSPAAPIDDSMTKKERNIDNLLQINGAEGAEKFWDLDVRL